MRAIEIPEIPLIMNPTDENKDKIGLKWAGVDEELGIKIGERHKIGGEPNWLQGDEVPICKDCKTEMSFYAQLDSISDDIILGDCGMIYVFVCFDCLTTESILQSY